MATPLPLEGDGLIENLFYFLWSKDDFGAGPTIYIPHTVLYKFTHPSAWYFTSLKSGKIKKKSKANLNNVQIEREFTKKRSPTDIVAYYIYFANNTSGDVSNNSGNATIEYFDSEGLRDFLYKREKSHNGMLQKFVLPKGTSNATIRAIWSPKICLLERRVNLKNVYDKRCSIYERGVTFDGADMYSRPEPVRGAMLPGEVQLLCEQIVDHVTQVSYHKYRISRMVLHLKSDADDKLWLLWCSSLRLLQAHATEAAPIRPLDIVNDAQVPDFVQFRHNPSIHDDKRMGFARCMSCGQLLDQKKLLATTYKAVLDHFQRFMRFLRLQVNESEHAAIEWPPDERLVQAAGGVGFGILQCFEKGTLHNRKASPSITTSNTASDSPGAGGHHHSSLTRKELMIPPVIQYLHPTFTVDDFERHRQDPIFLHKPVAVCESCCLVYSDYTTTSLEVNSIRQTAPAILRPHCELSDTRKRLDPLDPLTIALAGSSSSSSPVPLSSKGSTKKPPASAWKPIVSSTSHKKSSDKAKAHSSTLSNLLPSAPQLPHRIDSFEELQAAHFADLMLASGGTATNLTASQSASALQQREESFFRELHQQKDLERGHPLHHMLESAARLATSKKHKPGQHQLAALRNNNNAFEASFSKSRSVGALPELHEHQMSKKATKSPYSIVMRIRESTGDDATDIEDHNGGATGAAGSKQSSPKKRIARKTKKGKQSTSTDAGEEGEKWDASKAEGGPKAAGTRFISSREKKASEDHQDFLFAALADAQAQVRCFLLNTTLAMAACVRAPHLSMLCIVVLDSWSTWRRWHRSSQSRSCIPATQSEKRKQLPLATDPNPTVTKKKTSGTTMVMVTALVFTS